MCVSAESGSCAEVLTEGRQGGPLRGVHGAIKDRDHGTCSDGGDGASGWMNWLDHDVFR